MESARTRAHELRRHPTLDDCDVDPRQRQLPSQHQACRSASDDDTDLAVVGVSPGWIAVERMAGLYERQQAEMESVTYIGRAVSELACDPAVARRSGQTLAAGDLARIYGFTDLDGRQQTPYVIEP